MGSLARWSVAAAALWASAAWADPVGKVSFLEGSATRTAAGQTAPLQVGSEIARGDHLSTADGAKLELMLADGSVVRLGPKSELDVADLRYDPETDTLNARFHLALGAIWSHVEKLAASGTYQVETDRAVAGVRGTEFRVDADPGAGAVELYEGKVAVSSASLALAGEGEAPGGPTSKPASAGVHEVLVTPGQRLELRREGMVLLHRQAAPDELARFAKRALPERRRLFQRERLRDRTERRRDKRERRQERRDRLWRRR